MKILLAAALSLSLASAACAQPAPGAKPQTTYALLKSRPHGDGGLDIAYGPGPDQHGRLLAPKTSRLHPVVVLIHGGCWSAAASGLDLLIPMAEALQSRGFAVWNIEYSRLGDGGGYPSTFTDVGRGMDKLRDLAGPYKLDLDHIVVVGHSAGGHLAAWTAARGHLPAGSPLAVARPVLPKAVVTLGGIPDLKAFAETGPGVCKESVSVPQLVAGAKGDPFADTSPAALLPLKKPIVLVSGELDTIVPSRFGEAFAAKAAAAGDKARSVVVIGADHMQLVDPFVPQWGKIADIIAQQAK